MAVGHHIEIPIYDHKLVTIAYIGTKFDSEDENAPPPWEPDLASKFTSAKIQDGGDRHFEIS